MLWGCGIPHVSFATFEKQGGNLKTNGIKANNSDYKVIGTLPDSWEISSSGQNKGQILKKGNPVGLIEVVGYNAEKIDLPNHSSII